MKTVPMKKQSQCQEDTEHTTVKNKYQYDAQNDIFSIHKGFLQGEHFERNDEHRDLILDISTRERIVGIELMNASRILALSEKQLRTISTADFKQVENEQVILIMLNCNDLKRSHYQKKIALISTSLLPDLVL